VSGDEFRKLRKSVGYSQAKLSTEMKVTIRSITRWETGEIPVPKMAELALRFIALEAKKQGRR